MAFKIPSSWWDQTPTPEVLLSTLSSVSPGEVYATAVRVLYHKLLDNLPSRCTHFMEGNGGYVLPRETVIQGIINANKRFSGSYSSPHGALLAAYNSYVWYAGCFANHQVRVTPLLGAESIELLPENLQWPVSDALGSIHPDFLERKQMGVCAGHRTMSCRQCRETFSPLTLPAKIVTRGLGICPSCIDKTLAFVEPALKKPTVAQRKVWQADWDWKQLTTHIEIPLDTQRQPPPPALDYPEDDE